MKNKIKNEGIGHKTEDAEKKKKTNNFSDVVNNATLEIFLT
jgi:hypothetical protein